jgi:hypothetical protein
MRLQRREKPKPREVALAEKRLDHAMWLTNWYVPENKPEKRDPGRRIDPASPEGRAIIAQLGLTASSSAAA